MVNEEGIVSAVSVHMLYKLTVTVATAALTLPANLGKMVASADMYILDVPQKKKSRGETSANKVAM
jgi:hypothetical protein